MGKYPKPLMSIERAVTNLLAYRVNDFTTLYCSRDSDSDVDMIFFSRMAPIVIKHFYQQDS